MSVNCMRGLSRTAAAAALGWGLMTWAPQALACELTMETPEAVRIDYNPFALGASSGPLDIVLHNGSGTACELRLSLLDDLGEPLPGLTLGGVAIEFRPRETSGVFRRDVEPGVFLLSVPPGGATTAELDALVISDVVVEAGEHSADLRLAILMPEGDAAAILPLRLVLQSTPRAQVNIAGSAGAFGSGSTVEVVDFGTAATGLTRRVFVQVRANAASTLTVNSEHRGVMRHTEVAEGGTVVPYSAELDGHLIDLSETWVHRVDPPRTIQGVSLPLDFTLGAVTGQMSGRYEDLLTIDISPN